MLVHRQLGQKEATRLKVKTALYLATAFSGCLLFTGFARGAELKFNTQDFAPFNYEIDGVVSGPASRHHKEEYAARCKDRLFD